MTLESYKLFREINGTNPRDIMRNVKKAQIKELYEFAMDREDSATLNGQSFKKSPRIFNLKQLDTVHYQIEVETIEKEDVFVPGDYMQYNGMTWLCMNSFNFHGLYTKGHFRSCNLKLYYQNKSGEIKSVWCVDMNSTQYNSGETTSGGKVTLGSAQHMLYMPLDNDTLYFDDPQRFCIDRNIISPTIYKVTQNDNTPYAYGKGLCTITVSQAQLNNDTDKLNTLDDGTQVWICDYKEPVAYPNETRDLSATISGKKYLNFGLPCTYTVTFKDSNGNILNNISYFWNLESNFDVTQSIDNDKITLQVDDEKLAGDSFLLQVLYNGRALAEKEVIISGGY